MDDLVCQMAVRRLLVIKVIGHWSLESMVVVTNCLLSFYYENEMPGIPPQKLIVEHGKLVIKRPIWIGKVEEHDT